jgi:hypothetical protein
VRASVVPWPAHHGLLARGHSSQGRIQGRCWEQSRHAPAQGVAGGLCVTAGCVAGTVTKFRYLGVAPGHAEGKYKRNRAIRAARHALEVLGIRH